VTGWLVPPELAIEKRPCLADFHDAGRLARDEELTDAGIDPFSRPASRE